MADIVVPTATAMKLKFKPAFDAVDDAALEFAIEEAAGVIDDDWIERDQTLGMMYFAAHLVAMGLNTGDSGGRAVISETIGRLSVTYAQSSFTGKESFNERTSYGQRFNQMLRGNASGAWVV